MASEEPTSGSGEAGTAVSAQPDPRTCTVLYKILTPKEKQDMPSQGWNGTAFDQGDGFIHLSTAHQVAGTLERFFSADKGAGDELVLLAMPRSYVNTANVELKFEPAAGTEFGHIYGAIDPSEAFVQEYNLKRGSDGSFALEDLPF